MKIYLVDHASYRPPEDFRFKLKEIDRVWNVNKLDSPFVTRASTLEKREAALQEADDIIKFQHRVLNKAGLGEETTYLPPSINPVHCGNNPKTDLASAAEECKMAVCGAVGDLLHKTGLDAKDVDILVTTCSIYCPTPSMASMVVNHFNMSKDIESYHLGGMGCSNGVVAVNLVRDLLQAHPNANAIFVTNETTTPAFYRGQDKSRLVTNVLFRMGASAMLLSNKKSWTGRAKYQMHKALRIHRGYVDDAYRCIWYGPDSHGLNGVALGMNIIVEATAAMKSAMTKVAPYIMTWRQIFYYLANQVTRRGAALVGMPPPVPKYTPCFRQGIQHFLLHAGGAKVLEGMGKSLSLTEHDLEPSRAVLYEYGNVSSSTTWYTLGYVESVRGVRKGDTVLQVGVGSGIKSGICVWKAARDIDDLHDTWVHRCDPERLAQVDILNVSYSWRGQTIRHILTFFVLLLLVLAYMFIANSMMQSQQEDFMTAAQGSLHALAHQAHAVGRRLQRLLGDAGLDEQEL